MLKWKISFEGCGSKEDCTRCQPMGRDGGYSVCWEFDTIIVSSLSLEHRCFSLLLQNLDSSYEHSLIYASKLCKEQRGTRFSFHVQAWCYRGMCDARSPHPPTTTAPCSLGDDRLVCPLHMEWEWERENQRWKKAQERKTGSTSGILTERPSRKSIWRKSISHLCHGSHHQTWFPLTSSHCPPYHFLAPATMYVEGLCITSLRCQLIMLDRERERAREVLKLLKFFLSCQICMIHIQCGGKEPPIWRPSPSFCLQKRTEQWARLTKERSSSAQSWILRHRMRHLRCTLSIHSAFPGLPHTIKSTPPFLSTKQTLKKNKTWGDACKQAI